MVRRAHDFSLVVKVHGNRLAVMNARNQRGSCHVKRGPLDIAEKGVRFDIFGVIGEDNMARGVEMTGAAGTDCLVAENPVVFAVSLAREPVGSVVQES